jgi:hypothetical protein
MLLLIVILFGWSAQAEDVDKTCVSIPGLNLSNFCFSMPPGTTIERPLKTTSTSWTIYYRTGDVHWCVEILATNPTLTLQGQAEEVDGSFFNTYAKGTRSRVPRYLPARVAAGGLVFESWENIFYVSGDQREAAVDYADLNGKARIFITSWNEFRLVRLANLRMAVLDSIAVPKINITSSRP